MLTYLHPVTVEEAANAKELVIIAIPAAPAESTDRIALSVAGDDTEQKKIIMELIDAIGFDPIDGGLLS